MHAIKGGWTGRPLALAKNNEAEGRKTRIRRSKEERKAMVEVFIKKYQESNNGSFPSLNLTHKEVGGSFYTVREIVRDIIQENRILGPGKLLLEEEHNTDHSLEQNPLHSIAIEPQSPLTLSSKEVHFPLNYNKYINEEPIFVSDEQCTATNIQGSQNESIINGSLVDVSNEDSDEFIQSELLVNEHKEVEEVVEKESGMPKIHATPLATDVLVNEHNKVEEVVKEESGMPINHVTPLATDVVVETFPLDPVPWDVNGSDVRSEILISTNASEKQVSQSIELESDVGLSNITASDSVVEKAGENFAGPLSETKSDLVEVAQIVEISNGSTVKEGSMHEVGGPELEVCSDTPISVNFEQGQKSSKMKSPIASENLNKTFSNDFDQASKIEIENKVDPGQTGGSQKESVPTLNRINLESWEGMSKNSSKPENNPLLEIIKSFIAAFVKFWSE
ncbi:uncharacterized protein LOC103496473 isoform X1 [Cucumis melo]|uniref:Uncharacterized protein LOC103496473 isoform X1 n=1 Tax=Cucumis melo TaxID=3656 RepID=A0A1S3C473_CUCME|nr:uncharacterized protein LOC103496473 isoform X1 [Cucumis melo]XP_008456555.2 uncharacterized protein LOC103496473 isoform X1 [Cucumis melo]XP_008456556.2 uncharacterized protein LOC103496473 isoform X1 [Cucumis melo]